MANKRNDAFELGFSVCPTDGARLECYDSRPADSHRWRRYRCPECGSRHSTYEVSEEAYRQLRSGESPLKKFSKVFLSMQELFEDEGLAKSKNKGTN